MDIKIVIAVNKKDVWFCRICVASIRYYYPKVEILLLKDYLNGKFSTKEIEETWNAEVIKFSIKNFGWSAAKIHFYTDERFANQKFLVIDSDIVFVGRLLDQLFVKNFDTDVIVSEEAHTNFKSDWFKKTYYDYITIKSFDSEFEYPGYSFNCGQLFCKGNFILKKSVANYFNFSGNPSWKRTDIFPLVDQSLFNYLLPKLASLGSLKIGRENYMLWSESKGLINEITISDLYGGTKYPYLIHWAGALRTPVLSKMSRSDILNFFENYYYSQVKYGRMIRLKNNFRNKLILNMRQIKRNLKINLFEK